jgi:dTDP-4-amino-4,6-dideoxygalactose transaminase
MPTLPERETFKKAVSSSFDTGIITNGPLVRQLELEIRDIFHVNEAIAVSSCTNGLMLAIRCLGIEGKVALPSFTFFATAHSIIWNGLEPVFIDVDPLTWNISVDALRRALEEIEGIVAIMPVHIFGSPCDVASLKIIAREHNLTLIYDSAHGMGARVETHWIGGYGDAEVFSLSPTKLVVAGEGGIITTDVKELAETLRAGRDYGNEGNYNPTFIGLNARMSEFHAALAIESLNLLEQNVRRRNILADKYKKLLAKLPGLSFQVVRKGNLSTYKDLTIVIDEEEFGLNRDILSWQLKKTGIDTRKYYYPPVHRAEAYWEKWGKKYDDYLPVTNILSKRALSLPIWSHMKGEVVERVSREISEAHERADRIKAGYRREYTE